MLIEEKIIGYLSEKLEYPVYAEEPERPPKRYVRIMKTGAGRENHISSAVIAVQSYGEMMFGAAELNETIKSFMLSGLVNEREICSVKLNSDYDFTDTKTRRYRYQAVYNITFYEE